MQPLPPSFRAVRLLLALAGVLLSRPAFAQTTGTVIFDMDTVVHQRGEITGKDNKKIPVGTAEPVEGKFGKAVKFTFAEGSQGGYMTARVRPDAQWDRVGGFSFWVKGDGSQSWGGIELVDKDDFGLRYAYCFPIESKQWEKVVVPWGDLTPELAGPMVGGKGGYAPSGFGNFWFGKWFYWRDYPAHSYAIDQVALEPEITPDAPAAFEAGLTRLRAKLAGHKPVTIVTMGDSLSDTHHWSNKTVLWSQLLAKDLKARYGSEVTLINPAIGGTTLSQNMVLMPRWGRQAPSPDLVTIWFGGNDWDSNVRGPRFAEYLRVAVDRIRRQTHGSADVLLMTTCPGHARWETLRELEQAVREVAAEKKTGLADIAAEFHKVPTADEALKQEYWAWDKVHLGAKGHEVTKDAVIKAIDTAQ
jgi:lysophospholipase L1-like esterase